MRKVLLYILLLLMLPQIVTAIADVASQELVPAKPIGAVLDSAVTVSDSLPTILAQADSILSDSIPVDSIETPPALPDTFVPTLRPVITKVDLEAPVDFNSSYAMVILRLDSAF
ncbi:MAG: hypothetical protein K2M00_02165, partial [Muribaculaceae bacterium]|nr:hypothetical protein [Muribaculaceae bacterium]